MKKTIRASLIALTIGTLVAGCGQSPNARPAAGVGAEVTELVFAAVPSEESQELEASFAAVVKAIEKETGLPVRFEAVSSNAGVVEGQVAERVDIAVYGAFSYYLARNVADVSPVAVDQRLPGDPSGVESYGVVKADSGIQDLAGARGKNVCFTDPASTTGYLAPSAGLIEAGLNLDTDIKAIYAGGHDTAVASLLAGDCDVAFAAATFIDELLPSRGLLKEGETKKIWTSPTIPGPPIVVGGWLSDELQTKISTALTKYNAVSAAESGLCEGAEVPAPEAWGDLAGSPSCVWGGTAAYAFVPTDDAAYAPIQEICEVTNAEVCAEGKQ